MTIAGGVELLSDVPIRFNPKARKFMMSANKAKQLTQKLGLLLKLRPSFFGPTGNPIFVFQYDCYMNVFRFRVWPSFRLEKLWAILVTD